MKTFYIHTLSKVSFSDYAHNCLEEV